MSGPPATAGPEQPARVSPDDWIEFQQLLANYAAAIDHREWELLRDVFTADCALVYPGPWGVLRGIEDVIDFTRHFHGPLDASQHLTSNLRVLALSAQTARLSSSVSALLVRHRHPDGPTLRVIGFYTDDVVRTGSGWRIQARDASRTALVDGNPQVGAWDWTPGAADTPA